MSRGKITESGYYWISFCKKLIVVEIDVEENAIYFMGDETSSSDLNDYKIKEWIKIEKPILREVKEGERIPHIAITYMRVI